jgi:hypothetical protein
MAMSLRFASCVVLLGVLGIGPAHAQDKALQKRINSAIDRGVDFLRKVFSPNGLVEYQGYGTGMTSLVAWTLLESGVPADDPLIEKAAALLRERVVNGTSTYDLAVAIMFFDRLGYAADEPLIEGMAIRLLAAQNHMGSWGYQSGLAADEERLGKYMRDCVDGWKKGEKYTVRTPAELSRPVKNLLRAAGRPSFPADASNTQFAMLALWVARRHGLPVDDALLKVARCFRESELPSGAWDYHMTRRTPQQPVLERIYDRRLSLTCAGLLSFALERGVAKKQKKQAVPLMKDPGAVAGLNFVGEYLKNPEHPDVKPLLAQIHYHYFLFSMERMAVVFDLKKIGETDWYVWGAEKLVNSQGSTGYWGGQLGPADSCFALLFLKRANVAKDLTLDLKGIVRERGPSETPKSPKAPKKNLRERDPFDVPNIAPKEKKSKSQPATEPKKESRGRAPSRNSSQLVQDSLKESTQHQLRVETKGEVAAAENVVGRRRGAARLQARLEHALVLL